MLIHAYFVKGKSLDGLPIANFFAELSFGSIWISKSMKKVKSRNFLLNAAVENHVKLADRAV